VVGSLIAVSRCFRGACPRHAASGVAIRRVKGNRLIGQPQAGDEGFSVVITQTTLRYGLT